MSRRIRILIVDDHAMMRFALAEAISAEDDLTLVAEATNGPEAVALYRQHLPDAVVMDYQLPGMTGSEATARILAEHPKARVLLLSMFEGAEDIWRAVQAGVSGYVTKSAEIADVLLALRRVAAGEKHFPASIASKLAAREAQDTLSPREQQMLTEIVNGRSNKEIAFLLSLSESAVKLYISNALSKLGVQDRTQAAIEAVRRGIVHLGD
ncbi:MAG: response regulator transcription factor [Verrucomicrobiaceae bacterium]|nr:response regulator transcription factor [Verrucomicrobiaceae bacterium]